MPLIDLKIGGVPEHFNLPWYLTLKDKAYHPHNVNLRWRDYFGGTGAMCKALRDREIDMAVILTEGIIRDIVFDSPTKIVQVFVASPLQWGIHVAANSTYTKTEDLKGTMAAISRYGSGSHLMAYVNAQNNNWDLSKDLNFEVIKDLQGAIDGLPYGKGDYFMWEKFTTKPYVDQGIFRRLDVCPTPWPCFVIAVHDEVLKSNPQAVKDVLAVINKTTSGFKAIPSIDRMIANRYGQQLEDVQQWLSLTEWSQNILSEDHVERVQKQLFDLNIIPKTLKYKELVSML